MRKVTIASLGLVVLMFSLVGVVLASHYEYLAEDPDQQVLGEAFTENYVFYWWAIADSDLWWWSEGALHSDVSTVITNWTLSVPELSWRKVSQSSADVQFKLGACPIPGGEDALGCIEWKNWIHSTSRDANYWNETSVWISPNYNFGPGGRQGTIAHEIGHLYGLHERYIEGTPAVCTSEITVMDTVYEDSNGQWLHCDNLTGPVQVDENRVTSYWSEGEYANFVAVDNGNIGIWDWEDEAWAEHHHWVTWFYWDGSQWIEYHNKQRYTDIGVHRITESRTLEEIVNRMNYGAPAGWHVACGHPYFLKWGVHGTWKCSNVIQLQ